MRATLTVLVVVLVAQLVLAAALHLNDAASVNTVNGPLIALDRAAIDAVGIADSNGNSIQIERTGDGWSLPKADGFAASTAKVDRLLNNARTFAARMPVARSEASWRRFNVASDQFKRRIQFMVDDQPRATLLLGESAGPGRVYARLLGQDMIYEVDFALNQAATGAEEWLDRAVAAVPQNEVRKVVLPAFSLQRDDQAGDWSVVRENGQGEVAARAKKVRSLLRRLAQPDFQGVAKAAPPEATPAFAYTLVTQEGQKIRYAFYDATKKDGKARFFRADQPWAYQVTEQRLAKLKGLGAKRFVAAKSDNGEQADKMDEKDAMTSKQDTAALATPVEKQHVATMPSAQGRNAKPTIPNKDVATAESK